MILESMQVQPTQESCRPEFSAQSQVKSDILLCNKLPWEDYGSYKIPGEMVITFLLSPSKKPIGMWVNEKTVKNNKNIKIPPNPTIDG